MEKETDCLVAAGLGFLRMMGDGSLDRLFGCTNAVLV